MKNNKQIHTIIEMDNEGNTIKNIISYDDWNEAIEYCRRLNANCFNPNIGGYEVVTENQE